MTNEKAIELIKESSNEGDKSEKLACMYAMEDIIMDDINSWLEKPIHNHIEQFIDIGKEVLSEYIDDGRLFYTDRKLTSEDKQRTFVDGAIGLAESMYHYARIYHELKEESLSER